MIIARIAFRNLFRQRRRSLLTGLMMAGGCFLFSVFIGIADGSYDYLIDMFTRDHTGHIQIHKNGYLDKPSIYKTIKDPVRTGGRIAGISHVESWAPRVYSPALAFAGTKTTGVRVMGLNPVREAATTRLRAKVKRGKFISEKPLEEVVINKSLARVLKVDLGEEIALIAQGVDGSIANGLFTVAGITDSGETPYGLATCYMHIDSAREFLSMYGGGSHEIALVLSDHAKARVTARRIKEALNDPSVDVEPWQVVESQFYKAMQADIKGNWVTIMVLTVILAVGVLNTVLMVILERTREFGVLRALGTRPLQVFVLIVMETACLALLGIVLGAAGGVIANWLLSTYGITLSEGIEYGGVAFNKILGKISLKSLLVPPAVVLGTAVLVSIPPALRAARIKPVSAMEQG
jgi:ABC-type lipoprotein release transport system permease subunit